jgi:hypothetical protein
MRAQTFWRWRANAARSWTDRAPAAPFGSVLILTAFAEWASPREAHWSRRARKSRARETIQDLDLRAWLRPRSGAPREQCAASPIDRPRWRQIRKSLCRERCAENPMPGSRRASRTFPQVSHATGVQIFRPLRQKNRLPALGAFIDRSRRSMVLGVGGFQFHVVASRQRVLFFPNPLSAIVARLACE